MTDSARQIREGNARALARAATGIENRDPQALETLRGLAPFAGHARIVGITGPPGAGKSTLVDALASALRREEKTLAILAVDPTSGISGGAILGDRIRMQRHHADPGIFIRSMATRGNLGGLARATAGLVQLMDAAGKDYVLIETVGVGQAEVEIAGLAQVTVVVLVPGMGDDVQTIKAGIMEIADVFAINKSDQPGADRVEQELEAMLGLSGGRKPAIVKTVATTGVGIDKLLDAIRAGPVRERSAPIAAPTIDHIGIAVRSLEDSIAFYESLGLAVSQREAVDAGKVHVAMLPAGDSRIELLESSEPDSPIGLHHIALRVPDVRAAAARLEASGARLLNVPRPGVGGQLHVFVHPASTGGVLLELIEESGS
jgi:LAO/AO transport system kinase